MIGQMEENTQVAHEHSQTIDVASIMRQIDELEEFNQSLVPLVNLQRKGIQKFMKQIIKNNDKIIQLHRTVLECAKSNGNRTCATINDRLMQEMENLEDLMVQLDEVLRGLSTSENTA